MNAYKILLLLFIVDLISFTYWNWGLLYLLSAIAVQVSILSIFSETDFTRLAQYVARILIIALVVQFGISTYPIWGEIYAKIQDLFPLHWSYWKFFNLQNLYFSIVNKVLESQYLFSLAKSLGYLIVFDFACFLILRPIVKIGRLIVSYFSFNL